MLSGKKNSSYSPGGPDMLSGISVLSTLGLALPHAEQAVRRLKFIVRHAFIGQVQSPFGNVPCVFGLSFRSIAVAGWKDPATGRATVSAPTSSSAVVPVSGSCCPAGSMGCGAASGPG